MKEQIQINSVNKFISTNRVEEGLELLTELKLNSSGQLNQALITINQVYLLHSKGDLFSCIQFLDEEINGQNNDLNSNYKFRLLIMKIMCNYDLMKWMECKKTLDYIDHKCAEYLLNREDQNSVQFYQIIRKLILEPNLISKKNKLDKILNFIDESIFITDENDVSLNYSRWLFNHFNIGNEKDQGLDRLLVSN